MIRYSCPKCDTRLKAADDKAGTKATCPKCGELVEVPSADAEEKKPGRSKKEAATRPSKKADKDPQKSTLKALSSGDLDVDEPDSKKNPATAAKKSSPVALYGALGLVACAVIALAAYFVGPRFSSKSIPTARNTASGRWKTSQPPGPEPIHVSPPVAQATPPPAAPSTPAPAASAPLPAAAQPPAAANPPPPDGDDEKPAPAPPPQIAKRKKADSTGGAQLARKSKSPDAAVQAKAPESRESESTAAAERTPPAADVIPQAPTLKRNDLYNRMLHSTCWIVTLLNDGKAMSGTGSLVDRQNHLILTNYHVIQFAGEGTPLLVMFPLYQRGDLVSDRDVYLEKAKHNEALQGWVEHKDPKRDLALIRVPDIEAKYEPIRLSSTSGTPGEEVFSVGNPSQDVLWVLTEGFIRGNPYRKHWAYAPEDAKGKKEQPQECEARVISTQSPVNHGDSGGPLVNGRCELLAVTAGMALNQNLMNFFIDVSEVRSFLAEYYKTKGINPPSDVGTSTTPEGDAVRDVSTLMRALKNRHDPDNRARAANELAGLGPDARSAVPELAKALEDKHDNVRLSALTALEAIGMLTQAEIPPVVEAMKDHNPQVREKAILVIKRMGPDADVAVPALAEALRDPEPSVRLQAAKTVGSMSEVAKAAIPALTRTLESDKVPDVRSEAALALAKMGTDAREAVPALREALKGPNRDVQLSALVAVQGIGPAAKEALPEVAEELGAKDREMRRAAIQALKAFGPSARPAMDKLIVLFEDKEFRDDAAQALAAIGKDAVRPLIKLLGSTSADVRLGAVQALGEIGPEAKSALRFLLVVAARDVQKNKDAAKEAIRKITGEG